MKNSWFKKNAVKLLAGICAIATLAGCGQSNGATDSAYGNNYSGATMSMKSSSGESYGDVEALWENGSGMADMAQESGSGNYNNTSASNRKLIKNVNMKVETQEYETLMQNLDGRVKELGGYIQSLESYNGSDYGFGYSRDGRSYGYRRYANVVARIPQAKLDEFVNSIAAVANVVSRNESVEDVTLQYVDVKSHKESLQVEQARLLELLEKAETLDDFISFENRLTSVRYQIDSMESTLRTYDDLVDYSTVTLRIDEVEVYTPTEEPKKETRLEKMVNGFVESVQNVCNGLIDFGIWIVIHLPYLVLWGIVITVIVLVIKKCAKKDMKKRQKKAEEMAAAAQSVPSGKPEDEKK